MGPLTEKEGTGREADDREQALSLVGHIALKVLSTQQEMSSLL